MWVGIALIFISLLGASYTRQVSRMHFILYGCFADCGAQVKLLIALQGVVYSIGGCTFSA